MKRSVKHFTLHRIAGTELRVVSDVESGVIPFIRIEEQVIGKYAGGPRWRQETVTLFILRDLEPLARQLSPAAGLPPGGLDALPHRPIVNLYDLENPASCHVFINQGAMEKEGYWNDPEAIMALLAHEHAHPLAECETTRSSRELEVQLSIEPAEPLAEGELGSRHEKVERLLSVLVDKLCPYAPREVFANEVAINGCFGEALLHLDRRNVANAGRSVAGREALRQQLQQDATQGTLTPAAADALLLIGDLKGYLELALEVAPFYRAGRDSDARELETVLETAVFPHLGPQVARAYRALRGHYIALDANLRPSELRVWGEGVLKVLAEALSEKELILRYRLQVAGDGQAGG